MTNFAPVAPLALLEGLEKEGELGSCQLVIAPIVLRQWREYNKFFAERGADQFVILDNGVIELGAAMPATALAEAAKIAGADLVVMPDTIDDGHYTVKQARRALEDFRKLDTKTDTMGVVQGTTPEEVLECALELDKIGVDWFGVPKGLTPHLGSRVHLVRLLADTFGKPMHILGFSDNVEDDIKAAVEDPLVRTIDSAMPVWTGLRGLFVPPSPPMNSKYLGKRPPDFWTDTGWASAGGAASNVKRVRRWLRDAQDARINEAELAESRGPKQPS